MKRRDLIRHLEDHDCQFLREGGNHTVYVNRRAQKTRRSHGIARSSSSLRKRSARISISQGRKSCEQLGDLLRGAADKIICKPGSQEGMRNTEARIAEGKAGTQENLAISAFQWQRSETVRLPMSCSAKRMTVRAKARKVSCKRAFDPTEMIK